MDNIQNRLTNCFSTVFPGLPENEIPQSTQFTISQWDSVAVITLANVIEEEFGFPVDFDRLPEFDSFEHVLNYVRESVQGQAYEAAD
ncbi:MAG TPA: acyl carrier protein [Candidatus Acidoferrales bacterium]|jgi:acyl carrier protein